MIILLTILFIIVFPLALLHDAKKKGSWGWWPWD